MTPTDVLVVDWRPHEFESLGEKFPQIRLVTAGGWAEAEPRIEHAEILVTVGHDFTRDVAARMPALRWLQSMISGTDGALAALADRPDVLITSARGIHGPQMTEAALHHMLCLSRNVRRSIRAQDDRRWDTWDPQVLHGRTVGIVGIGVVAEHLAPICRALGMRVLGVSRTDRPVEGIDRTYPREQLAEAAAEVDFLVLTIPLDDRTRGIVDRRVLNSMKPTAFLINLARGGNVDTDALVEALRSGAIAGASLDAFEPEPLPAKSPLWELDNVLIAAHMGGRSDRYVASFMKLFVPNLRHWLDGNLAAMTNVVQR